MKNPYWFNVIQQWKEKGKGEYGVTLPFLVGAIAKASNEAANETLIREIFHEIIENPVSGYYCKVRWCGNINEPVASVKPVAEIHKVSIKSQFVSKKAEIVSLAFTTDLMSMFNLNCSNYEDCLEKLIASSIDQIAEGNFSKNGGIFTPFTAGDLRFIEEVKQLQKTGTQKTGTD